MTHSNYEPLGAFPIAGETDSAGVLVGIYREGTPLADLSGFDISDRMVYFEDKAGNPFCPNRKVTMTPAVARSFAELLFRCADIIEQEGLEE